MQPSSGCGQVKLLSLALWLKNVRFYRIKLVELKVQGRGFTVSGPVHVRGTPHVIVNTTDMRGPSIMLIIPYSHYYWGGGST